MSESNINSKISIIKAEEINRVMEIINDAKALLKPQSLQWQQGYPNESTMLEDIKNRGLFGYYLDDLLVGVVALVGGKNPYYVDIYEGEWDIPANENDLVIHRIAVKKEFHHKKIGDSLIKFSIKYARDNGFTSLKSDTHIKNEIMQNLLLNNGFKYKGVILLGRDKEDNSRLAYELDI